MSHVPFSIWKQTKHPEILLHGCVYATNTKMIAVKTSEQIIEGF